MAILTYNRDKVYNPKLEANVYRRSMQKQIKLNYVKRPVCIPILNFFFKIPFMKMFYRLTMLSGLVLIKIIANKQQKKLLNLKQKELLMM